MNRIFGATAIFAGWLSFGIGAMTGMVVSEFFGLNHVEGPEPPLAVYGISGAVVLWILVAAAIVTAVPMALAMVAEDPRRNLRIWALIIALGGVAILPDPLGRAFGSPLLGGAVCLLVGGELVYRGALSGGSLTAPAPAAPAPQTVVAPTAAGPETTAAEPAASSQASPVPARERGHRTSRRTPKATDRLCPWCSTSIPAAAGSCPNCAAILDSPSADEVPIPGLTVVPPELQRYSDRARMRKSGIKLLTMIFRDETVPTDEDTPPPSDSAALRPPDAEVKAEMARLDAEIAAGMVPIDDKASDIPPETPAAPPETPASPPVVPQRRRPRN